jgi:hypothetical protein
MVRHLCSFVNTDDVCHRKGCKLNFCLVLQKMGRFAWAGGVIGVL